MAKSKKETINYNYRVFIINNKNDIDALNEFLSSSDNSICGVRYYNYKKDSLIVEAAYININSDTVNIPPAEILKDSILYDKKQELISLKPIRPHNKRFYTCDYILNGEEYSVTGIAYNKKQFKDRIYSKEQRLKNKLGISDESILRFIKCKEITMLEYMNIIKNNQNS